MKPTNWEAIGEIVKKSVNARITPLGVGRATVSIGTRPVAILWDVSSSSQQTLAISLRASIMPNEAGLLVAALAINMMVMVDEPFEFGHDGERLEGEDALEYVFGAFYDKKRKEKFDTLDRIGPKTMN